ncbi:helix-turn-helix domain-containing protein [Lichenihabitans psoromatis]|uniref:helix-turn-helix domain-containing protein n=1 Tax=Lichenihabitans psoromatis TaxID=2528642 RepID=UPI0010382DF4|nr:helix-turn-helix transcriptional regulator [Lichenihabitans psoromatis]
MARNNTVGLFRRRLESVIGRAGLTTSGFARLANIDRSTLSQLLDDTDPRLPRADTLMAIATAAHVSTDWLLGLSQREEVGAEIIQAMLQIEMHDRGPADDHFVAWLNEAEGYRIRTVPVALPDFVKTEAVLQFEYGSTENVAPVQFDTVRARLDYMSKADNDVEVCLALQDLQAFADGQDIWSDLPLDARRDQIEHLNAIYRSAYPGLRFYLYDRKTVYSAPFTVFGPKRAVVFLGPSYLVLNGSDHIRMFARRFDDLIRLAVVQPHGVEPFLHDLLDRMTP